MSMTASPSIVHRPSPILIKLFEIFAFFSALFACYFNPEVHPFSTVCVAARGGFGFRERDK
jgi:hypothetical protein